MATVKPAQQSKKTPKVKQMELPDASKGVVTRFPPEPSGYLHVGHAKAALLNDFFAHVQYPGGKMILRFDDTNIEKEKEEYESAIREDVSTLGISPDQVSYTSDYFDQLEGYCAQLITSGKAYADDTAIETMKDMRKKKLPSERRDESIDDNLERFRLMRTSQTGMGWCIRAKISFDSSNAFLRDPVIYRCPASQNPHHRTGTKYRAYPTYQFACPIVDSLEGVTHALRTTEYDEQNALYKWILKALGLRVPFIWTFSKIQFIRTLMSKRKLTKLVDAGTVSGWDDPRFPTIRGVRRRGMTMQGLRDFMISQGPSKNVVNMDWHTIWAFNKKVIDPQAGRFTAISSPYIICEITGQGIPSSPPSFANKPKHVKYDLGMKKVYYGRKIIMELADATDLVADEEITLMNWGNAIVHSVDRDEKGQVSSISLKANLDGDFKLTKKKLTWLSTDQQLVPVELVEFDHLLAKDKLSDQEEDRWEEFLTPQTEFKTTALADCNVQDIMPDEVLQFDRKGYFRCDRAPGPDKPGIFYKIPTGKD